LKKDKVTPTSPEGDVKEKIAKRIVGVCICIQQRWAGFMQQRLEKFSVKGKKYAVICFCFLFGGYSIFLIAQSIIKPKKFPVIRIIKRPAHILESGDPKKSLVFIPEPEFKKIDRFQKYMDSLKGTKSGKTMYDRIVRSRPKLMDSIIQIQRLYKQQNK
jgi:hypothetical protein